LESFLGARTAIGARLRTLDNQESQNEKFILDLQTTLSDIETLDYAEAISRFNIQDIALQAAQQSFTRVQNLSLFNFL
jgi:flagellar hook-associated protein 3 FlgL